MRKTFKKLLAMAVVAVMLVSTLVSGLVVSAATPGSLNFEATTTVVEGKDAAVAFKLTFTDPMSALHMLTTITSDLKIADVTLGDVTYVTAPVDPEDPELESPALRIDTKNLDAGKILFESGIAGAVEVTEVNFTVTFDTDALAVGEKTFAIAVESTNYDEANFDAIEMTGAVVVEAAHVCEAGKPVDNGDGTHDVPCTGCDVLIKDNEAHNFVDGACSVCGAKEPVTGPVDIQVEFQHTLSLQDKVVVNIFVKKTDALAACDSMYLEVDKIDYYDGQETPRETVKLEKLDTLYAGAYYWFEYDGIRSTQFGDEFNAVFYAVDGDTTYKSQTDTYSVMTYVNNILKNNSANAVKLHNLVADVAVYGAAAQTNFNYRTDKLVYVAGQNELIDTNKTQTNYEPSLVTRHEGADGLYELNNTLELASAVNINYIFTTSIYNNASDLKLVVEYATGTVTYTAEDVENYQDGKTYKKIVFDKLVARHFSSDVKATLYDGDTPISKTKYFSVESYANQIHKTQAGSNLDNLMLAVLNYSKAAMEYLSK